MWFPSRLVQRFFPIVLILMLMIFGAVYIYSVPFIKDKVYEMEIPKDKVSEFTNNHIVLTTIRKKETIRIRFVSETTPNSGTLCQTTLEDAYLYTTKK